jgi:uncharacterized protein YaaN involved in tellurite resistance
MVSTRELLEARKDELATQLSVAVDRYDTLLKTLNGVSDTISAVTKELQEVEHAIRSLSAAQAKGPSRIKIMDAVLETLSRNPHGMTAKEILADLNAKYYGGKLMRHSLSPQLSRLKNRDKKIEYRNERWIRLPQQPSLFPPIKRRV